jgi:hypothetical protein
LNLYKKRLREFSAAAFPHHASLTFKLWSGSVIIAVKSLTLPTLKSAHFTALILKSDIGATRKDKMTNGYIRLD